MQPQYVTIYHHQLCRNEYQCLAEALGCCLNIDTTFRAMSFNKLLPGTFLPSRLDWYNPHRYFIAPWVIQTLVREVTMKCHYSHWTCALIVFDGRSYHSSPVLQSVTPGPVYKHEPSSVTFTHRKTVMEGIMILEKDSRELVL